MCTSCGCGRFSDDHSDSRHITLSDLQSAATASDIKLSKVAQNISDAVDSQKAMKSAEPDNDVIFDVAVVKSDAEQRYVLMVAYPAMKADVSVAQDGHRDFAKPDVIEKACFSFMRKGCKLGMWHESGHNPGEVVENYVYRGPQWISKSTDASGAPIEQVIEPGDWLVGMILTPEAWQLYKSGAIGGASPQGRAKRRTPDQATLAQLRN